MSLSERANQFVNQLCTALIPKLNATSATATSTASLRQHLHGVFRGLPTGGAAGELRDYLLQPKQLEQYVQQLEQTLEKAKRNEAATGVDKSGPTHLFGEQDYLGALGVIDQQVESNAAADIVPSYEALFLPHSAPVFVHEHLLRTLTLLAKSQSYNTNILASKFLAVLALPFSASASSTSPTALLEHLESILILVSHLSTQSTTLLPISSLIDRIAVRFNDLTLSVQQLRRYQNLTALLLLQEAKRKTKDQWALDGAIFQYVLRIRTTLRKTGSTGYSGSLAAELMFLQHALVALQEQFQLEKSHKSTTTQSSSTSTSNKRPRSEVTSSTYQEIALFTPIIFNQLWQPIFKDLTARLSTATRGLEGCESEWLRFALLIRSIENLPSTHQPLRQFTQDLVASIPNLQLPLTLRTLIQDRLPGLNKCAQFWQTKPQPLVKQAQLERFIQDVDGDLTIRTAMVDASENEAEPIQEEEKKETGSTRVIEPQTKKAKKAQKNAVADTLDSFGAAKSSSLFFLDSTGTRGATSALTTDGTTTPATASTSEEVEVGRSMTKILASITPQQTTLQVATKKTAKEKAAAGKAANKAKKLNKKGKKAAAEAAAAANEASEGDEVDEGEEAEDEAMGEEEQEVAIESLDAATPMEVDEPEEDAPTTKTSTAGKSTKKKPSTRVKKESTNSPVVQPMTEESNGRTRRGAKKK